MYEQYKDRVEFLTIYIREAHPKDEWQMESNEKDEVCYVQPRTIEGRAAIARDFVERFHFPIPLTIDLMDNTAEALYAAWPERLYVVDEHGRVVYKGGIGPFGYHPEEVAAWLAANAGAKP